MPENEFEKQVKDTMEGFHLSPSAPVWEAIKMQIEKKKRRILPFILLLAAVIIAGGYFMYINVHNNAEKLNKKYTSSDNIINKNAPSSAQVKKDRSKKKAPAYLNLKDHQLVNSKETDHTNNSTASLSLKNEQLPSAKNFKHQETRNSYLKNNEPVLTFQPAIKYNTSNDIAIYRNEFTNADVTEQKRDTVSKQINVQNDSDKIVFKKNTDSITKINNQPAKNDSSKQNKNPIIKKNNKSSNWQWGVTVMYGRSNLNDNLFNSDFSMAKSLDQFTNPATVNSNTSAQLKRPYNTKDAYNFGITIRKKIFNRSYLNTGLQYVYLSNKSTTARNLDSSLVAVADAFSGNSPNGYYRFGSEKSYINKYNFIELPLFFQSNIFHIKQFALSYDAGFSMMQLLSSKSLLYNSKNNSFFTDDNLVKRTQFQLLTGLNIQLNIKNKGSFLLGPHVEYSVSRFLKSNDYNRLHFINYGLHASWLVSKK